MHFRRRFFFFFHYKLGDPRSNLIRAKIKTFDFITRVRSECSEATVKTFFRELKRNLNVIHVLYFNVLHDVFPRFFEKSSSNERRSSDCFRRYKFK